MHLSSAHPADDTRVGVREVGALRDAGFDCHLVACDALHGSFSAEKTVVVDREATRRRRMTVGAFRAWRQAMKLRPELLHLHDPELIPYATVSALLGKTVIYDAHEDLYQDIHARAWIQPAWRTAAQKLTRLLLWSAAKSSSAVVCATDHIEQSFSTALTVVVRNAADASRVEPSRQALPEGAALKAVVTGAIGQSRGIDVAIEALSKASKTIPVELHLIGQLDGTISASSFPDYVVHHGRLPWDQLVGVLSEMHVGLALYPPTADFNGESTKLFEYMAAGLVSIVSPLPRLKEVLSEAEAGATASTSEQVASLLRVLYHDAAQRIETGASARRYSLQHGWTVEAAKLVDLYDSLVDRP